ncbi:MAG: S8 family serine peptidase [Ottowia sp.]|nr:S8 family serine peptidase [Ottowia sp.]
MQNPRRLEQSFTALWLTLLLGQVVDVAAHPAHASLLRNNNSQHSVIGFADTDIPNHHSAHLPEKRTTHTFFDNTASIANTQTASNPQTLSSPLGSLNFSDIEEGHQYWHDQTPNDIAITFSTSEEVLVRDNQPWLNQINQPYAAELGIRDGRNITIGFADSALQIDHPLIFGKVRQTYNAFANSANVDESFTNTQNDGHATTVVSTALGSLALVTGEDGDKYLQGVAPGAKVAMTQTFSTPEQDRLSSSAISNGIAWLARSTRVPIINLSFSTFNKLQRTTISAMQAGIARDVLFTIAANSKTATESYSLADYASADWAKKQIIVVGAVDSQNQATDFSEPAGALAQWYVVAPGSDITVASNGQTYANKSSAAFAAPMVAGQAALIKSFWPQLKAATIAQIIFKTATHLGDSPEGTPDPIYGWGLINVRKSLQPIGQLTIQTRNGTYLPVASLALGNVNGALGGAIQQAAAQNAFVISGATDIFNRQFSVNLNTTIAPETSRSLANMMGNDSDRMIRTREIILDRQGSRLSYTRSDLSTIPGNLIADPLYVNQNTSMISAASLIKRFSNGHEFAIATGGQNNYFGLADYRIDGAPQLAEIGLANAYHNLAHTASSFAIGQQLSNGLKIKFGMIGTHLPDAMSSQRSVNPLIDTTSTRAPNEVTLGHFEISKQMGNSMLGFGFSIL